VCSISSSSSSSSSVHIKNARTAAAQDSLIAFLLRILRTVELPVLYVLRKRMVGDSLSVIPPTDDKMPPNVTATIRTIADRIIYFLSNDTSRVFF